MAFDNARWRATLKDMGGDILDSDEMQREHGFMQHGHTSCYTHSINVACASLWLAERLRMRVDRRSMVRGALLHDFFLYDWHDPDPSHRMHGFRHPGRALRNAERSFDLNRIERNVIHRHMFPLTPIPPRFKEGMLVCLADKLCAINETLCKSRLLRRIGIIHG